MAKSLFLAYTTWLFGGWFGLHHIYLGRDRQAFVWYCSAGGFLGLGWFRDLWRIPEYVEDANDDPEYLAELGAKMEKSATPSFSTVRFTGEVATGMLFGFLARCAIPEDWVEQGHSYLVILAPYAIGIGKC